LLTGGAFRASILPVACSETGRNGVAPVHPASTRLVSETTESLPNGVTKTTLVVEYDSLPPNGARTTQTSVKTVTPTETGEVIEVDMTFAPDLPFAVGQGSGRHFAARYEFTFGAVNGTARQDTLVVRSSFNGAPIPPVTKHVLRSVVPSSEFATMTNRERLSRATELENRYGHMPHNLPGIMKVLD